MPIHDFWLALLFLLLDHHLGGRYCVTRRAVRYIAKPPTAQPCIHLGRVCRDPEGHGTPFNVH